MGTGQASTATADLSFWLLNLAQAGWLDSRTDRENLLGRAGVLVEEAMQLLNEADRQTGRLEQQGDEEQVVQSSSDDELLYPTSSAWVHRGAG